MNEQTYELILVEKSDGVGLITLNRPQALNALNMQVMFEVTGALLALDLDDEIGCIVITGSQLALTSRKCRILSSPTLSSAISLPAGRRWAPFASRL